MLRENVKARKFKLNPFDSKILTQVAYSFLTSYRKVCLIKGSRRYKYYRIEFSRFKIVTPKVLQKETNKN